MPNWTRRKTAQCRGESGLSCLCCAGAWCSAEPLQRFLQELGQGDYFQSLGPNGFYRGWQGLYSGPTVAAFALDQGAAVVKEGDISALDLGADLIHDVFGAHPIAPVMGGDGPEDDRLAQKLGEAP